METRCFTDFTEDTNQNQMTRSAATVKAIVDNMNFSVLLAMEILCTDTLIVILIDDTYCKFVT